MRGHATVASICALMEQDARWRGKSELLVETASGVLPIRYRAETNEVMMTQAPAQFAPFGGDREALMASIGLHAEDLDESLPLVYGSTGVWTLIVLVRDLAAFERMQPDNQRFPAVLTENPCASVHPITRETRHSEAQMHGRHFSSAFAGTTEDPVTGTASGVMGAYALRYLQPDAAAVDLVVEQGQEIGKDGIVGVHAGGSDAAHILKTTVFLTDMADFESVNAVYKEFISEPFPARTCIAVKEAPRRRSK